MLYVLIIQGISFRKVFTNIRKCIRMSDDITNKPVLFGTGEIASYTDKQIDALVAKDGKKVRLYRAICNAEYDSLSANSFKFVYYANAMEMKWFATSIKQVRKWGDLIYSDNDYQIIEATLLRDSLPYMFFVNFLDNIGPAYAADIMLLNKIVRKVRLL